MKVIHHTKIVDFAEAVQVQANIKLFATNIPMNTHYTANTVPKFERQQWNNSDSLVSTPPPSHHHHHKELHTL